MAAYSHFVKLSLVMPSYLRDPASNPEDSKPAVRKPLLGPINLTKPILDVAQTKACISPSWTGHASPHSLFPETHCNSSTLPLRRKHSTAQRRAKRYLGLLCRSLGGADPHACQTMRREVGVPRPDLVRRLRATTLDPPAHAVWIDGYAALLSIYLSLSVVIMC